MENENIEIKNNAEETQTVIDFGKIFRNYLHHWWWFLISLVICMGMAAFYLYKKSPEYLIKGMIMLNQEEVGGVGKAGSLTAMMNLLGNTSSDYANPENEQMKLLSQTNLTDVVNELHLQYNYWSTKGFFFRKKWLYPENPIAISIPQQIIDTISVMTKFHVQREKGSKQFKITVHQDGDKLYEANFSRFPYSARTPYGTFTLTLTKYFDPNTELNLYATASSTPAVIHDLRENLAVSVLSKKADAIQVDMGDVNIQRGIDIVNAIISNYNHRRDNDRMAHNKASLEFIDNRLMELYNELDHGDSQVEQYKKDNRLVNAEAEATYMFTRMTSVDEQYVQLKARLANYTMFRDMLLNPATRDNQIPFTASDLATSEAFGQFMSNYNNLINYRMELEVSAKAGNVKLDNLQARIDATRETILKSLDREIQNTKNSIAELQREINERDSRMAGMPSMEHRLLAFERDQVVKNQIYAFLLQKREETNIALSQNEPVGKVIDYAYPELKPVSPKKLPILLITFFLALFIPAVWLQMRASSVDKKNGK